MKNKSAKSFVTIMIVIAVSALFLRIAIEKLIKVSIAQNESNAAATLKLISAALESYAKDNRGIYPENLSLLTKTSPAYLDKDYITKSPLKGYNFSCLRLEPAGYSCLASPARCKLSGRMVYTVTTGSLFISEDCEKKD